MWDWLVRQWGLQRGYLPNWVPVLMGCGVVWYFGLPREPSVAEWSWLFGAALSAWVLGAMFSRWRPVWFVIALGLSGALLAGFHANRLAAPQLTFRYYGPIVGRIVHIDQSQSGAVRLTLDQVVLERMGPDRTPDRVRVSLHGDQNWMETEIGLRVGMTGHLSPPSGPVEPGGYDFQRSAWFDRLGAVGYTRTPAVVIALPDRSHPVAAFRHHLSEVIRAHMPERTGGFAAAIITGDRSRLDETAVEALRATNLAHLLAISGLHMGLLTGLVFGGARLLFALFPPVALRWPTRKIAAVLAIMAGAGYLVLSGASVATQRAFVMVTVMFIAVLLDRRAISIRSVAVAATLILIAAPQEVMGPGFQMSFAATVALVAGFQAMRGRFPRAPKLLRPLVGVIASSALAGLATAPFSAAHFNQISHYGLIANVLSVPMMGAVVMPSAIAALVLAPLGLGWIGFALMDFGLGWILTVAETVASWPKPVTFIVSPKPAVLGIMAFGGLWSAIARGHFRRAGLAPMALSAVLWSQTERPYILISDTGGLVGVMTAEGRALNKPKGDSFSAENWLQNDGDGAAQDIAAGRNAPHSPILAITGKRSLEALQDCDGARYLVTNQPDAGERPCETFDLNRLRQTGSVAIYENGRIETARELTGERLWNGGAAPLTLSSFGLDRRGGPEP